MSVIVDVQKDKGQVVVLTMDSTHVFSEADFDELGGQCFLIASSEIKSHLTAAEYAQYKRLVTVACERQKQRRAET